MVGNPILPGTTEQQGLRAGGGGSDFSFSALGKSMPRGPRSCLDSFASPRLCSRVWVRFRLPGEPHGLSFLAVYGSDQIRFLSSSQAGNFGFF